VAQNNMKLEQDLQPTTSSYSSYSSYSS